VKERWKRVRLREAAEIIMGQSPKSEFYNTFGEGLPFFQGCSDFGELYPSPKTYCTKILRVAEKDDVLMSVRAPVGDLNITKEKCIIGRGLCALQTKFENGRFLYYLIKSNVSKLISLETGAVYGAVNKTTIENLELKIPPLSTQRKIASILSAYDDLIDNNMRRIKILEEMAQAIYKEWFVKFRFPGHEKVKMVKSELGMIPEGWEVKMVQDTFEITGGGTPSKKILEYWEGGNINWYVPSDLTAHRTMFMDESGEKISELGLRKSSARLFPAYSVMMTSRATLGVISINTTEACTNQGFITCIPNEKFPLYTLYYWLHENIEKFIRLGTGATFKEITKGVFKKIEIIVPREELLTEFEKGVTPINQQVLIFQRKSINLRKTRDLLLPKLISGEIDVEKIDIEVNNLEV